MISKYVSGNLCPHCASAVCTECGYGESLDLKTHLHKDKNRLASPEKLECVDHLRSNLGALYR